MIKIMTNLLLVSLLLNLVLIIYLYFLNNFNLTDKKFLNKLNPQATYTKFKTKNLSLKYKVFFESKKVGIYQIKLNRIKPHFHPQISSLLFIIGGSASGYIGNKKYNAKKGDFIFVPNNTPHHWKMNEP
ncbi:MAG: cupin domain-containing protein, partial [Patescibacteria group bacterium]|nr:cupin domain-containing protein [Patescibacteria group bacterium]